MLIDSKSGLYNSLSSSILEDNSTLIFLVLKYLLSAVIVNGFYLKSSSIFILNFPLIVFFFPIILRMSSIRYNSNIL